MVQGGAVRCRVLQGVAACSSVLQHVTACCSTWQHVAACYSTLQHVADCCRGWLCVAGCCRVLQVVAAWCSVLQRVATMRCRVLQQMLCCRVLPKVRCRVLIKLQIQICKSWVWSLKCIFSICYQLSWASRYKCGSTIYGRVVFVWISLCVFRDFVWIVGIWIIMGLKV